MSIESSAEFDKLLSSNTFVVVDFYKEDCPPCRNIAHYYNTLPALNPTITFAKIDCDQNRELCSIYKISAVPTFLFFNSGKKIHAVYGGNRNDLGEAIEKFF